MTDQYSRSPIDLERRGERHQGETTASTQYFPVVRSVVAKKLFELQRRNRDAIFNIPARLSGIVAAESDQQVVFQLLTQELNQAVQKLSAP